MLSAFSLLYSAQVRDGAKAARFPEFAGDSHQQLSSPAATWWAHRGNMGAEKSPFLMSPSNQLSDDDAFRGGV